MKLQHGASQVHKRARSFFCFSFLLRAREQGDEWVMNQKAKQTLDLCILKSTM